MTQIAQRYRQLRAEVPANVAIVAVSKFQPREAIDDAVAAGIRDFGENYVQEAIRKFTQHDTAPTLHFIGHVQTNKAKAIAKAFDVVQSVDRLDAALALSKAAVSLRKQLKVLLQLNISPTERFGCPAADAERFAEALRTLPGLHLDGVMAIGPITGERDALLDAFGGAADLWRRIGGETLSIGMSGDWREAIEAGSTMIRVGTAIFGPRPARKASNSVSS